LEDLLAVLGDRPLMVARELTKRHEEQVGPTVAAALAHFLATQPLGECTLVLGGATPVAGPEPWDGTLLRAELEQLVAAGHSAKEASRLLAERTGHPRRDLYALLHQAAEAADTAAEGPG
jgi:16S rRNA (cytidine1402-2'-O)-methyltransferase